MTLTNVLLAVAAIGAVLTTLQTGLVVRLFRRRRPFARGPARAGRERFPPAAFTATVASGLDPQAAVRA